MEAEQALGIFVNSLQIFERWSMSAFGTKRTSQRAESDAITRLCDCSYATTMFVFDLDQILDHRAEPIVMAFF